MGAIQFVFPNFRKERRTAYESLSLFSMLDLLYNSYAVQNSRKNGISLGIIPVKSNSFLHCILRCFVKTTFFLLEIDKTPGYDEVGFIVLNKLFNE